MKIVRRITYEVPDTPAGVEDLRQQMAQSIQASNVLDPCTNPYRWRTSITVEHLEGPCWDTDGTLGWDVRLEHLERIRRSAAQLLDTLRSAETPEFQGLLDDLAQYNNKFANKKA